MTKNTLKEYSKQTAKELCKALALIKVKEVKGEGVFEVIATTEGVDRDGEVIMIKGWDFTNFMKNPVVLFGHDYWSFPIGAVTELTPDDSKVVAKGVFARTEEGQKARVLYEDGILKTVSVGFIPKERNGNVITKAELLELSFVPVPSNPEALDMMKAIKDFEGMLTTSARIKKDAIPHAEYPLADEVMEWDPALATEAVKEWASEGSEEAGMSIDFAEYKRAFAWMDAADAESEGAYKLIHHTVENDDLTTVYQGVATAMAALLAEDGAGIPEEERQAVYDHLAKHFEEFGKEVPEFKSYSQYELDNLFPSQKAEISKDQKSQINFVIKTLKQDVNNLVADAVDKIGTVMGSDSFDAEPTQKAGRVLSSKTRASITNAVEAMGTAVKELKALIESTDASNSEDEKSFHTDMLKMLQSIDKTVESGIVGLKSRVK